MKLTVKAIEMKENPKEELNLVFTNSEDHDIFINVGCSINRVRPKYGHPYDEYMVWTLQPGVFQGSVGLSGWYSEPIKNGDVITVTIFECDRNGGFRRTDPDASYSWKWNSNKSPLIEMTNVKERWEYTPTGK